MKYLIAIWITLLPVLGWAQLQLDLNANLDLELTKAGRQSHYYYNEIFQTTTDWALDVPEINLIAGIRFSPNWSVNARFLVERQAGFRFNVGQNLDTYDTRFPQLNVEWLSNDRTVSLKAGRFINPFGNFNHKQLSINRTFIALPLAYGYYVNISNQVGFVENLGEDTNIRINGFPDWGTNLIYNEGYAAGLLVNWRLDSVKNTRLSVAVTTGAANQSTSLSDPLHLGIISKILLRPTYFWEQSFSLSFGSFLESSEFSDQIDNLRSHHQLLLGTGYKLGAGYFEVSGEVIGAWYWVPYFLSDEEQAISTNSAQNVFSLNSYTDVRFEFPFLPGSYLAVRSDLLWFGNFQDEAGRRRRWDKNVWRNTVAVGYKITPFLLARSSFSWQSIENESFDPHQRVFRLMVTFYI